ncbi:AAA family ATPase [Microbacterium sp. NPDC055903]
MRIVVSGTHGTGKSTVISAFAARHPTFEVHADPHDLTGSGSGVDSFIEQFHVAARRLQRLPAGRDAVLERCPLDFLAYLEAWDALGRPGRAAAAIPDLVEPAVSAMAAVDLLVVLPLSTASGIHLPADEDLDLREEMDAALLTLTEDPDLVPGSVRMIELAGTPEERLAALEEIIR